MKVCILLSICITLFAQCSSELQPATKKVLVDSNKKSIQPTIPARVFGDRMRMFEQNDLRATIDLDTVDQEHLFAIGPVEGLQGEITVIDGRKSLSTVANGKPVVDSTSNPKAIFLVYNQQATFKEYTTDRFLDGLHEVETYIGSLLENEGHDLSKTQPFTITTKADFLKYHIIQKSGTEKHSMKLHKKAKQTFMIEQPEIEIVGFWVAPDLVGKVTHPGSRTHLHFIQKDGSTSGHIDHIIVPKGSVVKVVR